MSRLYLNTAWYVWFISRVRILRGPPYRAQGTHSARYRGRNQRKHTEVSKDESSSSFVRFFTFGVKARDQVRMSCVHKGTSVSPERIFHSPTKQELRKEAARMKRRYHTN